MTYSHLLYMYNNLENPLRVREESSSKVWSVRGVNSETRFLLNNYARLHSKSIGSYFNENVSKLAKMEAYILKIESDNIALLSRIKELEESKKYFKSHVPNNKKSYFNISNILKRIKIFYNYFF